ncbi:putative basic proline-rich protein-like [Iris pallida]|uniref:Basic proline-rich protein-like n=1 Tax=Iris pallida TaxID=29817 RepID=A0AAX6EF31_IRIPA|nr:putative basic proline-rich protein-like [Iris pallida]KAJ6802605.1 putative basic proline-rich protein-like [Iris pallida]KAJ6842139.1 putative basic proline-rich protein-like [Iris pallida]
MERGSPRELRRLADGNRSDEAGGAASGHEVGRSAEAVVRVFAGGGWTSRRASGGVGGGVEGTAAAIGFLTGACSAGGRWPI